MQLMIFRGRHRPGVLPQQHALVEAVAMNLGNREQLINTGG